METEIGIGVVAAAVVDAVWVGVACPVPPFLFRAAAISFGFPKGPVLFFAANYV